MDLQYKTPILLNGKPLIAGGAPEEGEEGTEGTEEGTEGTDTTSQTESRDGTQEEDHTNEDVSELTPEQIAARLARLERLEADNKRLSREAAQRERERRKAEAEARARDEKRREEQGQWKELAEERSREIEALKTQIAERDARELERERRTKVEEVADKLRFRRPRRAYPLLMDELGTDEVADTLEDATLIEAALKRMIRDDPSLVDEQRRSGAPIGRNGQQATPEQGLNDTILNLLGGGGRR